MPHIPYQRLNVSAFCSSIEIENDSDTCPVLHIWFIVLLFHCIVCVYVDAALDEIMRRLESADETKKPLLSS